MFKPTKEVMNQSRLKYALCVASLGVGTFACAAPPTSAALLPLTPGTYVVSTYKPCAEAPLAAVKAFDGKAFPGPHESSCISSIASQHGRTYQVSTECRALGDGTPEVPSKLSETIEVRSHSKLAVIAHGETVVYDLCPDFH
jgi:hypothetical protein